MRKPDINDLEFTDMIFGKYIQQDIHIKLRKHNGINRKLYLGSIV